MCQITFFRERFDGAPPFAHVTGGMPVWEFLTPEMFIGEIRGGST
jgi:hypothetical protein